MCQLTWMLTWLVSYYGSGLGWGHCLQLGHVETSILIHMAQFLPFYATMVLPIVET